MSFIIRQSTAITIPVFVFDRDGFPILGKVDGDFNKRISKNGAAFVGMTVTVTEMEKGWYSFPLTGSHASDLGALLIVFFFTGGRNPDPQVNLNFRVQANLLDDLATPAQVRTETENAFDVTTYVEPSAVPAATATLKDKFGFLGALARNKLTQTATALALRNDADGADIAASTITAASPSTRDKFA